MFDFSRRLAVAILFVAAGLFLSPAQAQDGPGGAAQDETPGERRVDVYGDPLPAGAIARLGTVRFRNPGWYKGSKFIPNTQTLVVGTPGEALRFWNAASGKLIREIEFAGAYFQAFDVSSDGSTIATLTSLKIGDSRDYNMQLELRDAKTDQLESSIQWIVPLIEQSLRVALSPDGNVVVTGTRHGMLRFRDVQTGDELRSQSVVERGEVAAIAFSPNGETVAVASRGGVYLWNWQGDEKPRKLEGLSRGAMSATFSPDGKWLATGSDDHSGARLFDVQSGRLVHLLKGKARTYYTEGVAFDPAGRLLAVPAYESGVELFDISSGEMVEVLASQRIRMRDVAISSDGSLLVGVSGESTMRVWNLATGEPVDEKFVGHNEPPYEIEFTPDGKQVVTGDTTGVLHMWDAETGELLHSMGHESWVAALSVAPDGKHIVTAGHDESIRVWDAANGNLVFKLFGHGRLGGKYKVQVAPDSQTFASFGPDMYLRTWSMQTGKALIEHEIRPEKMMLERDDVGQEQGERIGYRDGPSHVTYKSQISSRGDMLLVPFGDEIHVFDVQSDAILRSFAPANSKFSQFALSPNGEWLVTTASRRQQPPEVRTTDLCVIDFETNKVALGREIDGTYVREIIFSPDGRFWAMHGAAGRVDRRQWTSVWDVEKREEVARVPGQAMAVAFSPDNTRLATSVANSSVLIWDLAKFRREKE